MRIALATSSNLPDWEVDDRALHAALRERGAELEHPAWDDPEVEWGAHDVCLIRTPWDYMERRDAFVAWAERAAASAPLFNPPLVVRWNTHKHYLRDLEAEGVRIAESVWLERGTRLARPGGAGVDLEALVRERGWTRAFVKPCVGATARETLRFTVDAEGIAAAGAHVERLLVNEGLVLQPYLESVEGEGELSAIFVDGAFTHGVRKIPVPGDYRVQDDFGASDRPHTFTADELELARSIVERAGARFGDAPLLYARVDFLRERNGELVLNELELVEPSLFFRHSQEAAEVLADALLARI